MKAIEQYFPLLLFIMLYKVVLTFESGDEIPMFGHSKETSSAAPLLLLVLQIVCLKIKVRNFSFKLVFS